MTRKSLGSGIDGWIKDTKRSHDQLQEPAPTGDDRDSAGPTREHDPTETPIEIRRLAIDQMEVPPPKLPPVDNEDLEWLKASLFRDGQLQPVVARLVDGRPVLVTGYRRLRALRDIGHGEVLAIVHSELSDDDARKLYLSDNLPRIQADPTVLRDLIASVGVAEVERWGIPPSLIESAQHLDDLDDLDEAPSQTHGEALRQSPSADPPHGMVVPDEPAVSETVSADPVSHDPLLHPGILAVDDDSFEAEVIDAHRPVLVAVHLPGQLASDDIQQALLDARRQWGDVKLCAVDMMACDGPAVPQLVKVGRGFLEKHLPRVQLYHGGFQRRELTGARHEDPLDAETLIELLDDEIG